ncbi:hypothetical protein J2X43_000828 [Rhizobium sp. BE258]|jgi:hypothetical protein|nr:hypothetical protein [Rhizobium sp. BE258]
MMRNSHLADHLDIAIKLTRAEGSELLAYLLQMAKEEIRVKRSMPSHARMGTIRAGRRAPRNRAQV